MPCSKCGQKSQDSLAREREREARAKQRRAEQAAVKAAFADRRRELIAQVKAQREARGR